MGQKYTSTSSSGYNSTPPPDDGTRSEANKTKWSTIRNKLTDVLKTFIESINTKLVNHFDYGPVSINSATTTLGATYNNKFVQVLGSGFPVLDDASALGAGWYVDLKNDGSNIVTIARTTSNDTIDGSTADTTIGPLEYIRFVVNAAADGFLTGRPPRYRNVFVSSNEGPYLHSTVFVADNISNGAWRSIAPSTVSADNIWSALDSVPSDVDWIEVRTLATTSITSATAFAGISISSALYARPHGSSITFANNAMISNTTILPDVNGNDSKNNITTVKINVVDRTFDIYKSNSVSASGGITTQSLVLSGYGYNP